MEKPAEDECADSGAETGGSDYSLMSSGSSDLSMGDLQDPFLVSIHIITDPGQARTLQQAADQVLSWLHPDLTLFRVSERATGLSRKTRARLQCPTKAPSQQPALAVILFLQEDGRGEESLEYLHRQLRYSPWRYHHSERVIGQGLLPFSPASQDFVTLAPGTPLWALRQVHYGKEIVRFTIYCRHQTYIEQVRLYRLLLRRRLAQRKEDFCFCVVYSNPETEIQLSFKRLPRAETPCPTENAVMEIRVPDVCELVPLLPQPCTPISDVRWQTLDYDGNKILLQVQGTGSRSYSKHIIAKFSHLPPEDLLLHRPSSEPPPPPLPYGRGPACYRNRRYHRNTRSHTLPPKSSRDEEHHPLQKDEDLLWTGQRTQSLFSLLDESRSTCASPSALRPRCFSSMSAPVFRVNVDTLVGAEETDVDTGRTISGSSVDLSVVSGYSRSPSWSDLKASLPRPKSAPLTNGDLDCGALTGRNVSFFRKTLVSRTQSVPVKATDIDFPTLDAHDGMVMLKSNGIVTMKCSSQKVTVEDEQEFYI